MKIGLVYNLRPEGLDRNDPELENFVEVEEWKTIEAIGKAIEANGHKIDYYQIDDQIYERLRKDKDKIDLIFNFSEGINNGADREAQIPMVAEILGIAYTGPGPLSAALILNKSRTKEIWKANGVRTAKWQLFSHPDQKLKKGFEFPLIVKPNGEGSGMGIRKNSVVRNEVQLKERVSELIKRFNQPALVEEYLPGREFTVGLMGNGRELITLPIIEVNFDSFPKGAPRVDTFEAKFVYGVTGKAVETEFCPAKVTKKLKKEILRLAKKAYLAVECRDFGRVDLRMGRDGKVYALEINHPPGLMSDPGESSFFVIAARKMGWELDRIMKEIIDGATKRNY